MTHEAQRIAIAEACGWTHVRPATCVQGQMSGIPPKGLFETQPPSIRQSGVKAKRPRLHGALSNIAPFDVTAFQAMAHEANQSPDLKTRGAFGGATKRARFLRALRTASDAVKLAA
jgi:hypothetical protein